MIKNLPKDITIPISYSLPLGKGERSSLLAHRRKLLRFMKEGKHKKVVIPGEVRALLEIRSVNLTDEELHTIHIYYMKVWRKTYQHMGGPYRKYNYICKRAEGIGIVDVEERQKNDKYERQDIDRWQRSIR